jgi:hypothetical protein
MSAHLKHLFRVGLVSLVALLFAVQVNFVLPTSAQASDRHFDERDLKGAYVGSVSGASVSENGYPAAAVLRVVADGVGNLVWEARRNSRGTFFTETHSCTYVIESSGFGTITCPVGDITILLSDRGKQFDLVLQGSAVAGGHFILQ